MYELRIAARSGLAMLLAVALSGLHQARAQSSAPNPLANAKVVSQDELRRNNPFFAIHDKPDSDNATLIPQLLAMADTATPPYLYELARRLWRTDKAAALAWYALGSTRAQYDVRRCADTSVAQSTFMALSAIAPDVTAGLEADRKAWGEAGLRALARPNLFIDEISPMWACQSGRLAINAAMQGKAMREEDWLRPRAEWAAMQKEIRQSQTRYFTEQDRPQNDPIAMTTTPVPRLNVPPSLSGPFSWLDNQHLVAVRINRDETGKIKDRQLVSVDLKGQLEDIAQANDSWCAGSGVVSYVVSTERLPDRVQRRTFATGRPGQWQTSINESTGAPVSIGNVQSFSTSWSLPGSATHQSPFDCRLETDEALSGPHHAGQWIALLPGDGVIRFDTTQPEHVVQWLSAKGKAINIPIDDSKVSLPSFRYLAWKQAYFVAETWSRFTHKDKTPPSCIAGAYVYPKESRVEAACAPFDPDNTSNAVMVSPSRTGWLRFASARNTAQGLKTAGLYLIPPHGKAEKLLDTELNAWSLSPDGCRLAVMHKPPAANQSTLDILTLCQP